MENISPKMEKAVRNILFVFFLFLTAGYILLPKAFPKLRIEIGQMPLYITEIFLSISVAFIIYLAVKNKFRIEKIYLFYAFLFFFSVFLLSLSIGLYSYRDVTYVLRQSALFYYCSFYFIVFYLFNDMKKIRYFMVTIFVCTNLLAVVFVVNFLGIAERVLGGLTEYMTGGYYFPIAILLILEINLIEIVKRRFLRILILADAVILVILSIMDNVRGNWIALVAALIFSFIISKSKKKFAVNILIVVLVLVLISGAAVLVKPQLFKNTVNEIESLKYIFLGESEGSKTVEIANTNWRIIAWSGFLREYIKRPVFGWGFGKKFLPAETFDMGWNTGLADNWVATHNYIISFLFMSGIAGLISFGFIIVFFFKKNVSFLKSCRTGKYRYLLSAFLSSIFYILVLGLLEVVLEAPYQAAFFWSFLAFNILIIKEYGNGKNENITGS